MKYEVWATFGHERKLVQTTGWLLAAELVRDALLESGATMVQIIGKPDDERAEIQRKFEQLMRELGVSA